MDLILDDILSSDPSLYDKDDLLRKIKDIEIRVSNQNYRKELAIKLSHYTNRNIAKIIANFTLRDRNKVRIFYENKNNRESIEKLKSDLDIVVPEDKKSFLTDHKDVVFMEEDGKADVAFGYEFVKKLMGRHIIIPSYYNNIENFAFEFTISDLEISEIIPYQYLASITSSLKFKIIDDFSIGITLVTNAPIYTDIPWEIAPNPDLPGNRSLYREFRSSRIAKIFGLDSEYLSFVIMNIPYWTTVNPGEFYYTIEIYDRIISQDKVMRERLSSYLPNIDKNEIYQKSELETSLEGILSQDKDNEELHNLLNNIQREKSLYNHSMVYRNTLGNYISTDILNIIESFNNIPFRIDHYREIDDEKLANIGDIVNSDKLLLYRNGKIDSKTLKMISFGEERERFVIFLDLFKILKRYLDNPFTYYPNISFELDKIEMDKIVSSEEIPNWLKKIVKEGPECNIKYACERKIYNEEESWSTCCHTSATIVMKKLAKDPLRKYRLLNRDRSSKSLQKAIRKINDLVDDSKKWIMRFDLDPTTMKVPAHTVVFIREGKNIYKVHSYADQFELKASITTVPKLKEIFANLINNVEGSWASITESKEVGIIDIIDISLGKLDRRDTNYYVNLRNKFDYVVEWIMERDVELTEEQKEMTNFQIIKTSIRKYKNYKIPYLLKLFNIKKGRYRQENGTYILSDGTKIGYIIISDYDLNINQEGVIDKFKPNYTLKTLMYE